MYRYKYLVYVVLLAIATESYAVSYMSGWDHVNERTDCSDLPVAEIKHYIIHYGPSPDDLSNKITGEMRHIAMNPWTTPVGTKRYFVVQTVDTDGNTSIRHDEPHTNLNCQTMELEHSPGYVGVLTMEKTSFYEKLQYIWRNFTYRW